MSSGDLLTKQLGGGRKVKVRTDKVPESVRHYLTPGKIYSGEFIPPAVCKITDDVGDKILLLLPSCSYLDFAAWEIVESTGDEPATMAEVLERIGFSGEN